MQAIHRAASTHPWKLITTTDPNQTLGDGNMTHYSNLIGAANAFAKTREPYKAIIYDNGHHVRELTHREDTLVSNVCARLGLDVEQV